MTLTYKLSAVADALMARLTLGQTALGIAGLYYGDQDKLPSTPVVCVEPDSRSTAFTGTGMQITITLRVFILVYHSAITSPQTNRRDSDRLAEDIEDWVMAQPTLGGIVISSLFSNIESGYANRQGTLIRSSRMTFEAISKTHLPS